MTEASAGTLWQYKINTVPYLVGEQITAFAKGCGTTVQPLIYEGGPGYGVPGPGKKSPVNEELYGKSMALAVATLDGFLLAQELGFGPTCFFRVDIGERWATHSEAPGRPEHTAWLALQLRNRWCTGAVVAVKADGIPTVDLPALTLSAASITAKKGSKTPRQINLPTMPGVPLVRAVAYQHPAGWDVVLLSRAIDQAITVRVQAPAPLNNTAAWIRLAGDGPAASNREGLAVRIEEDKLVVAGREVHVRLPPASCHVIRLRKAL